jgi:hypothetical protein
VLFLDASACVAELKLGHNQMLITPDTKRKLRTEIETLTDPALLSQVGTRFVQLVSDKEIQIGLDFIRRAIDSNPGNPTWTEALESAQAEPIRRHNYRNGNRPSEGTATERP